MFIKIKLGLKPKEKKLSQQNTSKRKAYIKPIEKFKNTKYIHQNKN